MTHDTFILEADEREERFAEQYEAHLERKWRQAPVQPMMEPVTRYEPTHRQQRLDAALKGQVI